VCHTAIIFQLLFLCVFAKTGKKFVAGMVFAHLAYIVIIFAIVENFLVQKIFGPICCHRLSQGGAKGAMPPKNF